MKKRKCLLFILSLLAISILAIGCGKDLDKNGQNENNKSQITMGIAEDINDLNAHLYNGSMVAQGMIFEGLVENTDEGVKPWLAESWEISEDGKIYTFKLKKDVVFSDGEPFNAKAVKANIDAIQENKEMHNWLELSNKIVSCDVIDEHTVNLVLSETYYPTLIELGLTRPYRMMSPATFKNGKTLDGVKEIVGTGAYKLDDYVVDQSASFVANEKYWDEQPKISKVSMKVIPAGETPLLAMMNGEIDFLFTPDTAGMIDAEAIRKLEMDNNFQVELSQPCSTRYLLTNSLPDRIISDKNIKNAVWHAINRKDICEHVFSGFETPAQSIFAQSVPYCDVNLEAKDLNIEMSKKLIESSGWTLNKETGIYEKDGKALSLELVYNSTLPINKNLGEYLQANLKETGINIELVPAESKSVRQLRGAGTYDLYLDRSWGLPYDPQSTLTGLFSETAYLNAIINEGNKDELHSLIRDSLTTIDEDERKEKFEETLKIVHENGYFIPLSYSKAIITAKKDLKGLSFNQTQLEVPFKNFHY